MRKLLYCIRDKKENFYGDIIATPNYGTLERALKQMAIAEPNSLLAQFPADYTVYELGTFDSTTGEINAIKPVIKEECSNII